MIRLTPLWIAALTLSVHAQIEVKLKVDAPQDPQWARLTVSVKNTGTTSILSPRAAYDLAVPAGKIPVVEAWSVGTVRISLEQQPSGSWRLWFAKDGPLAAGQEWNDGGGAGVGVHLSDWSNWTPWTSPSFDANTGVWALNRKITVWDASGQLIWGPAQAAPVSAKGYSSINIKVGDGGRCNAVGTIVLVDVDHLDFRCMEARAYEPAEIWVDGTKRPGVDTASLFQDGKDHSVEARFRARDIFWSKVLVTGPGSSNPTGDVPVYRGDTLWIAAAANDRAKLRYVQIGGVQQQPSPRIQVPNVQAPVTAALTFEAPSQITSSLAVTARREASTDSTFSLLRIQVKNNGTTTVPSGWVTKMPFRVPAYLTPVLTSYDVPTATASIASMGEGWWMLSITSTQALLPSAIGGAGRGWYMALGYTTSALKWDRTGDVALPSATSWTNAPYIRVLAADGTPLAGQEWLMSSIRTDKPNLEVLVMDEGADATISRPRIVIKNNGPGALSDFYYDYFFCTEGGNLPVLEPWFQVAPRIHIEALGGFCYKIRYDFLGVTVAPGCSVPANTGNVVGVHYADWLTWDKTNDWSHTNNTQTLLPTTHIPVYDRWGNRLTGTDWTDPGQPGERKTDTSKGGTGGVIESVSVPPVIVVQPSDVTVAEDALALFEVRAAGDGVLSYQWRRNGLDLPGATATVYRVDRVRAEMNGDHYVCQVKSSTGWVLTREANLTVTRKPLDLVIQVQPIDDTVALGAQARFEVYATGNGALQYQWFKGSRPLAGQKTSVLLVPVASPDDTSALFWVRISDESGKVKDSRAARVRLRLAGVTNSRVVVRGRFERPDGNKVPPDTVVDLRARLFGSAKSDALLWSETHWDVPVLGGEWNIELGSSSALASLLQVVATHPTLYLELVLEGGIPRLFGPRIPLTAVPFAFQSGAKVVVGTGVPAQNSFVIGTLYLDQGTGKTWFRDATGWRALD